LAVIRLPLMLLLSLVIIGGSLGCQTRPKPAGEEPISSSRYPRVVVMGSLEGRVVAGDPVVQRDPDVPLHVTVPVRMNRDRRVASEYRFIFLDVAGRPVDPPMQWRWTPLTIAQSFVEGSSLDPSAVDWRLELRPSTASNRR
jgi:hypothetical protein